MAIVFGERMRLSAYQQHTLNNAGLPVTDLWLNVHIYFCIVADIDCVNILIGFGRWRNSFKFPTVSKAAKSFRPKYLK